MVSGGAEANPQPGGALKGSGFCRCRNAEQRNKKNKSLKSGFIGIKKTVIYINLFYLTEDAQIIKTYPKQLLSFKE